MICLYASVSVYIMIILHLNWNVFYRVLDLSLRSTPPVTTTPPVIAGKLYVPVCRSG